MQLGKICSLTALTDHDQLSIRRQCRKLSQQITLAQNRADRNARSRDARLGIFQNGTAPHLVQFGAFFIKGRKVLHQLGTCAKSNVTRTIRFGFAASQNMRHNNMAANFAGDPSRMITHAVRILRAINKCDNLFQRISHVSVQSYLQARPVCQRHPVYQRWFLTPHSGQSHPPRPRHGGTSSQPYQRPPLTKYPKYARCLHQS